MNIKKLWLIIKNIGSDKGGIRLFARYSFSEGDRICFHIVKSLASNELRYNKSILINKIIHKVNITKDLIENIFLESLFINDAFSYSKE